MKKETRKKVFDKTNGFCAYCGLAITLKSMQIDHIEPAWHNHSQAQALEGGIFKGSNDLENLNPSCRRCNKWKSTLSVEKFRAEIQSQLERLEKYSPSFKIARDYGLIIENATPVKFYFETLKTLQNG